MGFQRSFIRIELMYLELCVISIWFLLNHANCQNINQTTFQSMNPLSGERSTQCHTEQSYSNRYMGEILRCTIRTPDDYAAIPNDTVALWLEYSPNRELSNQTLFPPRGDVFPSLEMLEFLVTDITYITEADVQTNLGFTTIHLPSLRTYDIIRDLTIPENENQGFELLNYSFFGLSQIETLYLEGLAIAHLEPEALRGLDNLQVLNLARNYITYVPPNFFQYTPNLTSIALTENYIADMDQNLFNGLTSLNQLFLSLNSFVSLRPNRYSSLVNLILLDMSNNAITTIDMDAFTGLQNLKYLYLNGNLISNISMDIFRDMGSLTYLNLNDNDVRLSEGVFSNLASLEHLSLRDNSITALSDTYFRGLSNLTELNLMENRITTLVSDAFVNLPKLSMLNLNLNRIQLVEEHAFRGLHSLVNLVIGGNQITWLPEKLFRPVPNLNMLDINGNPWICDCRLQWLIFWLRTRQDTIQQEQQWRSIACGSNDPIRLVSFFTLIQEPYRLDNLCGPYQMDGTTITNTEPSTSSFSPSETTVEATTKRTTSRPNQNKNKGLSSRDIAIIAGCVGGFALVVLLIVVCCVCRSRQKQQKRSWRPPEKLQNKDGRQTENQGDKQSNAYHLFQFPSFYPDPDANHGGSTWEMTETSESSYTTAPEQHHIPDQNGRQNGVQNARPTGKIFNERTGGEHGEKIERKAMDDNVQSSFDDSKKRSAVDKIKPNDKALQEPFYIEIIGDSCVSTIKSNQKIDGVTENPALEQETKLGAEQLQSNQKYSETETASGFSFHPTDVSSNDTISSHVPRDNLSLGAESLDSSTKKADNIDDSLSKSDIFRGRLDTQTSAMSEYTVQGDYYEDGYHLGPTNFNDTEKITENKTD